MPRQKRNPRGSTSMDEAMGQRIKLLRTEKGMTQTELGAKLDVSFQQVQKYEKGKNRVGANRLQQIAEALDVPVTVFYAPVSKDKGQAEMQSLLSADPRFSLRLLRAYSALPGRAMQRRIVLLLEGISGISAEAEDE